MRAAIYMRISQDRDGLELGVQRQREDCLALAQQRGWLVVSEHVDNDISATSGKRRPGYQALLAQVDSGDIDRVVVYMTSRLWRNRRERVEGMERLEKAGVGLTPVKGPELDFTTATGRMVAGILGEVDTAEVEIKAERSRREVRQRAEQSRPHGGRRAYGITQDGCGIVEEEASDVRRWFDLILAGGSIVSIQRETGRHHASVTSILRNPRYAGLRILNGQTYTAPNPVVVPETTWRGVQAILDDPRRKVNNQGKARRWVGAGLYRCATCDMPVKTGYGGAAKRVYHCLKVHGGCGRTWIADRIDDYVATVTGARLGEPDAADLVMSGGSDRLAELSGEATGIRSRLDQLAMAFADDDQADLLEFRTATRRLRERLAEAEARLAQAGTPGALASVVAASDPSAVWNAITDPSRRAAIIDALMVVSILPSRPGRPRGTGWRPESQIVITWR